MSSQLNSRIYLLLISLLPMALLALYVQQHLPVTNPYVYYSIEPEKQSLTWSLVPSHFAMAQNPSGVPRSATLDLTTGRQSTLPYAFYQVLDERPDGTVTIQQFKEPGPGIDIAQWSPGAKASRILWRLDRLLPVLNHRYLLSSQDDRFVAYDLNHSGSQRPDPIDICVDPQRTSIDDLQCLDGTNNVLVSRTLGPNSVAIYSINDGQATEVTNWTTGGLDARTVIRQGLIYSLSQDGKSLEVRESQQFQVIDRLPLPANMIDQWNTARCSETVVTIAHPKTNAYESYRLRDLSPIPALNNWVPYRLKYGRTNHPRYQIFEPRDDSRRKLLVYDGLRHQITLEHDTGYDYVEFDIIGDDKLAIVDYRCGLTCKVVDLNTGKLVATHRPFFWPLLCTLVLNAAAIVWVIGWLRFSAQAGISMVADWFVLGAVIAAPMLYRSWTLTWMTPQPSMNLFHACWLVCIVAASYNLWFGRSRIVLRLCVCLIMLVASAGLLRLREWQHWTSSPTAIATVWIHFLSITLLSMVAIRLVTNPKIGAIDFSIAQRPTGEQDQNTKLSDLFTLTAVSALFIGSVLPMKANLKASINLLVYSWPLSAISIVALTVACSLFFSRLRIAEGLRTLLVAAAGLFVIGEWVIKLIDFSLLTEVSNFVYSVELAGLASVCFLIASAWAWRVRYSIIKPAAY